MLNALRHQWFWHIQRHGWCQLPCQSAQRLTASMVLAQPLRIAFLVNCIRAQRLTASMVLALCIMTGAGLGTDSAQRLTASMVSALNLELSDDRIETCSTPYGINGFGTTYSPQTSGAIYSAQRLTASMVSAQPENPAKRRG